MDSAQRGEDERSSASSGNGRIELPSLLAAAFAAGGEMGRRLREFDWSGSPLSSTSSRTR